MLPIVITGVSCLVVVPSVVVAAFTLLDGVVITIVLSGEIANFGV